MPRVRLDPPYQREKYAGSYDSLSLAEALRRVYTGYLARRISKARRLMKVRDAAVRLVQSNIRRWQV
jgi:hypothetical protein